MAETLTADELAAVLADAVDIERVRITFGSGRMEVHAADIVIALHSTLDDPVITVKGDTAFVTGSRVTVERAGEVREVDTDGAVHWTFPADLVADMAEEGQPQEVGDA